MAGLLEQMRGAQARQAQSAMSHRKFDPVTGRQMADAAQKMGLLTAPIPVVGDVMGLLGDAAMYAAKPEERTLANYGLTALGALPFVPSVAGKMAGKVDDLLEWAKGSKLVDAAGAPTPLYHGTTKNFAKFDMDEAGGLAWLTDDKGYAQWLADNKSRTQRMPGTPQALKVAARAKNPLTIDVLQEGIRVADEIGVPRPTNALEAQELLGAGDHWDASVKRMAEMAYQDGHDALQFRGFDDGYRSLSNAWIFLNADQLRKMD
jgi:hypothetical protein